MKIAIHHRPGSFSDRWIEYCKQNGIEYKIVNAYDSDIVQQVSDCDVFMWHHHHADYRDKLFAKQLLFSLEMAGIHCFPDFHTTWHFDDKVGQKYLFEAVNAPLVPSYVFYTKEDAYNWIKETSFPKVFKLRGGAGASNVRLVHTAKEARLFVKKAFGKGFPQFDRLGYLKDRLSKWREGKDSFVSVIKGIGRVIVIPEYAKMLPREKGYVYFQDFIPNNSFDIRVIVIGNKLLAEKRYVRKGDFRASGSGVYDYGNIPTNVIQTAFNIAKLLKTQCVAFDFIIQDGLPKIIEMSYGFGTHGISQSGGYWTEDLVWHEETALEFCGWMVSQLING